MTDPKTTDLERRVVALLRVIGDGGATSSEAAAILADRDAYYFSLRGGLFEAGRFGPVVSRDGRQYLERIDR